MEKKTLYIIAGCNGAGKTTASFTILPDILSCKEFINADEIAKGISPFQPEKVAIQAGRIMLSRIDELINQGQTFAFETTLSTKSYRKTIERVQAMGYEVVLLFFWLNSVKLAKERVKTRVREGGHNIPEGTIERRYVAGIQNLFKIYLPIVNRAYIFDNTQGKHQLLASKEAKNLLIISDELFNQLKTNYETR